MNYVTRQFEDEAIDLEVLVPGYNNLYTRVRRFYREGKWSFEDMDTNMVIRTDGTGPAELVVLGSSFLPTDSSRLAFSNGRDQIRRVTDGWRLDAFNGNWREYDADGLIKTTGRESVTMQRYLHTAGKLTGLAGPDGTPVITFEWNGNQISAVEDNANNRVEYEYESGRLSKVTDSHGGVTTYLYDGAGRMNRYVDATGLGHNLTVDGSGYALALLDDSGAGRNFLYSYDKLRREYYFSEKFTNGVIRESWYDAQGSLRMAKINGQLAREVLTDGRTEYLRYGDGSEVVQEYDEFGGVVKVTSPDGAVQRYEHDPVTRQTRRAIDPAGTVNEWDWDSSGNLLEFREAVGLPVQRVSTFTYDASGNPLTYKVTAADGIADTVTTWAYNAQGRLLTQTDPAGRVTKYEEYDDHGFATRKVLPGNHAMEYEWDNSGRKVSETNALGHRWQFEYDAFNNLTATIGTGAKRLETVYNIDNLPVSKKDVLGNTLTTKYGPDGRVVEEKDATGRVTLRAYDVFGRLASVTTPAGDVTSYEYADTDPEGQRPVAIVYPTFTRRFTYNTALRRVTTEDWNGNTKLNTMVNEIDTRGNIVKTTDSLNRVQTFEWDALGRLVRTVKPGGVEERMTWNRFDKVSSYTSPDGKVWRWNYNPDGQLAKDISPEGRERSRTYGANGLLEKTTEGNGDIEEITWDAAGRKTGLKYYAGSAPTTVQKSFTFTWNADNQLTGWTSGNGASATWVLDDKGRKTQETLNYGPFSKTLHWTYNADDQRATFTMPSGEVLTYGYDEGGKLQSIDLPGSGQITWTGRSWSRVTGLSLPGGLTQSFAYDALRRPASMTLNSAGGDPLHSWTLQYDSQNRILSRTMDGALDTYTYDDADRILTASTVVSTYDIRGNRTSMTGTTGNWTYNDDDELTAVGSDVYVHDARGSRTSGGGRTFTWDADGRLASVTTGGVTAAYTYDPFGRRLSKTVAGVTTYYGYSSEGLIAEYDATGAQLCSYGYEPSSPFGQRALWRKTASAVHWYVFDQLGTPWLLVDSNGGVVWRAAYGPNGAANVQIATVENNLRLPGQYFDNESGLHYNWNRYYDPATGRYLSRDPVRDEYNHFLYAQNDLLTKTDPDGLRAKVSVPIPATGGVCRVYTSLDFCECGVSCGVPKLEKKIGGVECKAEVDLNICNDRKSWPPKPKVCAAVGCEKGQCKAELFKACYNFNGDPGKRGEASGLEFGCKLGSGGPELSGGPPPIFNSNDRDGWGY
ncbi:MAG: hypothetical protein EOP86_08195 [Verrucomicrobiaceae bacterium]|nr:MAG: hypothetical protein EOP86_08195 [Verrucomicrobiaceae bacterium]